MDRIEQPLKQLLDRLGLAAPMEGWSAVSLWREIVGERIAAHSRAVAFRDGTLLVEVDSASWMNELSYLRRRMAEELNGRLGKPLIREIRLLPAASGGRDPVSTRGE